jgi:glutathionyl-hydroquinone reductase
MALLNDQFNHFATHRNVNLRPSHLDKEMERLVDWLYLVNNGVYQCGFAKSQRKHTTRPPRQPLQDLMNVKNYWDDRKYIAGDAFSWLIADRLNQR